MATSTITSILGQPKNRTYQALFFKYALRILKIPFRGLPQDEARQLNNQFQKLVDSVQAPVLQPGPLPQALVNVDNGCISVKVNEALFREFGGQPPHGHTSITCHCDQIGSMESLDSHHCILTKLRDRAKSAGRGHTGVQLAKFRERDQDCFYQVYLTTVSPLGRAANLVSVTLRRIRDLSVHFSKLGSHRLGSTEIELRHNGALISVWAPKVTEAEASKYFDFDRILITADRQVREGNEGEALACLRQLALDADLDMEYSQASLLIKMCSASAGQHELLRRIASLRARLFHGPAMSLVYDEIDSYIKSGLKFSPSSSDMLSEVPLVADFGMQVHTLGALDAARQAIVFDSENMELRYRFIQLARERGLENYARFIELQLRPESSALSVEEEILIHEAIEYEEQFGREWAGFEDLDIPSGVSWEYRRGFVEHLFCPIDLIDNPLIESLFARAPIKHLTLLRGEKEPANLPGYLVGLYSLSLDDCGLSDSFLTGLCDKHWHDLVWLSLSYNAITMEGVRALAKATSSSFPALNYLNLLECDADPREEVFFDNTVLTNSYFPPDAIALEEEFGHIQWLHRTTSHGLLEMNRYRLADAKVHNSGAKASCLYSMSQPSLSLR